MFSAPISMSKYIGLDKKNVKTTLEKPKENLNKSEISAKFRRVDAIYRANNFDTSTKNTLV